MRHAQTEYNKKGIIQGSEVDSNVCMLASKSDALSQWDIFPCCAKATKIKIYGL